MTVVGGRLAGRRPRPGRWRSARRAPRPARPRARSRARPARRRPRPPRAEDRRHRAGRAAELTRSSGVRARASPPATRPSRPPPRPAQPRAEEDARVVGRRIGGGVGVAASAASSAAGSAAASSSWPPASAATISNAGAGLSSSSASWPSAGTSVQPVSPFSQVWIVGKARVSPSASGSWKDSSKASRSPSGSGVLGGVDDRRGALGHLVAVGVGHRLVELLDRLLDVVEGVAARGHREHRLRDLDLDLRGGRALAAVRRR